MGDPNSLLGWDELERAAQTALRLESRTLRKSRDQVTPKADTKKDAHQLELELEPDEPCIGTCGLCGAYWDTRYYETCPSPCGGYVG